MATLSMCNPERTSPFMWWVYKNADELRSRVAGLLPLSLGHRLIDRALIEGPAIERAYTTLSEVASRDAGSSNAHAVHSH